MRGCVDRLGAMLQERCGAVVESGLDFRGDSQSDGFGHVSAYVETDGIVETVARHPGFFE
jgi:hypothetical protein